MDVPRTILVDGHVRIEEWLGREQPFTIWGGENVWYFAKTEDIAVLNAYQVKKQMGGRL